MLKAKYQRFVDEYLFDLNQTKAAMRAGFSNNEASANTTAYRLLKLPEIQAAIQEGIKQLSETTHLHKTWVLNGLKEVAERCMQSAPVIYKGKVVEGQYQFDASGANRSYELIGKHLGMFTEKHEHSGKDGKPIEFSGVTDPARVAELMAIFDRARKAACAGILPGTGEGAKQLETPAGTAD